MSEKFALLEKVSEEIIVARKAKQGLKVTALGMLKSKLLDNSKALAPIDEALVVKSYMKQLKEAMASYTDDPKHAAKKEELKSEIAVINVFMPKELGKDVIVDVVKKIIAETPDNQRKMGPVMGKAMKTIKAMENGKTVDGSLVKAVVQEQLES